MRPWQITYTAPSSPASKSTRIEHFGACHFYAFLTTEFSFLFKMQQTKCHFNVKKKEEKKKTIIKSFIIIIYTPRMVLILKPNDILCIYIMTLGGRKKKATWISRLLSVRDVLEYTGHAVLGGYLFVETRRFSLWALKPRITLGKRNRRKLANRRKVTRRCWP